ncbi:autotransporter domain-containing protein [Paraburkholderia sp.]|uniref:autotransporter domain-containing protein n=1 Tax=Paraburkholderia sp. TaxID=1926495 RepID=UPI00286F1074|nr:autotransporter domain-containing protein [Paraburkholderia sp.]
MNRVYSVVWNAGRGEWQAVAELAKRHGGKSTGTLSARRITQAISGRSLLAPGALAVAVAGALALMSAPDARAVGVGATWTGGDYTVSAGQIVGGTSDEMGLQAVGSLGTLSNSGTISGYDYGFYSDANTITSIANSGTIASDIYGLFIDSGAIGTITNTGTISGIYGVVNIGTIARFINSGVISGAYGLLNYGRIETLVDTGLIAESGADITIGSGSVTSPTLSLLSEGVIGTLIGTGIYNEVSITGITNNGTIAAGTGLTIQASPGTQILSGIYNDATGIIGTLTNNSTGVIGGASAGTGIFNLGTIGALTNSGTISGTAEGIVNQGTIGTLINTGSISGGAEGILNEGSIGKLIDAGSITTAGANITISSGSSVAAPELSLSNSGVIGTLVAAGIYNAVSITGITNSGTIAGGTGLSITSGVSNALVAGIYNDAAGTIGAVTNNSDGVIGNAASEVGIVNYGSIGALNNNGTIAGSLASYNAGTLGTLSNSGTIDGSQIGVANTGTIDSLSNSGTISGGTAAVFNFSAIGTLSNTGTISATGYGLSNTGGSIGTLSNSGTISGGNYGVYNDGTIGALNNSGTISGGQFAIDNQTTGTLGSIRNTGVIAGNIANLSSNALTISGASGTSFGTLTGYNNTIGTITSAADVNFSSGNILLNDHIHVGSGTVSNTSATLEVDNAVTITGNYTQGQAATLLVGVSSGTSYGSLVVTGNTTIASGSSVELKSSNGYGFAAGQRYVVVQTTGTAAYNASTLNYSIAGYSAGVTGSSVTESNGNTDLVVTLNDTNSGSGSGSGGGTSSSGSYASRATQSNAVNVLTGLLGYTGTSNAQLLNLYDATLAAIESGGSGAANRVGNQLSPVQTTHVGSVSTLDAMGVVATHLDALRVAQGQGATGLATGDSPLSWTAWGQAFGGHASQSERENVAGYSANYGGLVMGADRAFGDAWRVGGAFHYSHTATNYSDDQAGDSAGVNAFGLIGYASYQGAPWYVNLSGALTQQHYDTTRVVSMTGFEGAANGSFNGQQYAVHAELGWPLAVAGATLTPLASLTYSRLNQSGYTETGGNGAALTVGSTGSNSLRSAIGAKLEKAYQTSYGTLVPTIWAQWIHEYDQTRLTSAAYFSGAPNETGFTTTGATPVSNLADISLGVTLVRANNLSLSMRYDLQVGSGFVSNTGILRLEQKF